MLLYCFWPFVIILSLVGHCSQDNDNKGFGRFFGSINRVGSIASFQQQSVISQPSSWAAQVLLFKQLRGSVSGHIFCKYFDLQIKQGEFRAISRQTEFNQPGLGMDTHTQADPRMWYCVFSPCSSVLGSASWGLAQPSRVTVTPYLLGRIA